MSSEIHIHVEEPSMGAFLEKFLPRFPFPAVVHKIINHQSKDQLLRKIPDRLRGYINLPVEYRPKILILVDRDSDDCIKLKQRLEKACLDLGLSTKSEPAKDGSFQVVNRIVIEELEAWYFGAVPALVEAFPGVPKSLASKIGFRDPDDVKGGTNEKLLIILQRAGHYLGQERLPKIDVARKVAAYLNPQTNSSASFQQFWRGFEALTK
jgi:hypothetical protein